jgi:KDO2-lipid IV(A) lauroyltransferase
MAQHPYLSPRMRRLVREKAPLRHAVWLFEAAVMGLLWGFSALLSSDRASSLGRRLGRWLGPRTPKAAVVLHSLAIAFPERTDEERQALALEVWGNWGAMLTELPHLRRIVEEGRIEVAAKGDVKALREPGRAMVCVTGHISNWQLSTVAVTTLGVPLTVVYTSDSNPYVARLVTWFRRGLRCHLVEQAGSARTLLRELRAGRSVGLVVDVRRDDGEPLPFFGLPAPTSLAAARLALKTGCEFVPGRVERLEGARFRITLYDPILPDDPDAPAREQARQMMSKLSRLFESWVRERPEEWLCVGRRWNKETLRSLEARPKHGRAGALQPGKPSGIDGLPST